MSSDDAPLDQPPLPPRVPYGSHVLELFDNGDHCCVPQCRAPLRVLLSPEPTKMQVGDLSAFTCLKCGWVACEACAPLVADAASPAHAAHKTFCARARFSHAYEAIETVMRLPHDSELPPTHADVLDLAFDPLHKIRALLFMIQTGAPAKDPAGFVDAVRDRALFEWLVAHSAADPELNGKRTTVWNRSMFERRGLASTTYYKDMTRHLFAALVLYARPEWDVFGQLAQAMMTRRRDTYDSVCERLGHHPPQPAAAGESMTPEAKEAAAEAHLLRGEYHLYECGFDEERGVYENPLSNINGSLADFWTNILNVYQGFNRPINDVWLLTLTHNSQSELEQLVGLAAVGTDPAKKRVPRRFATTDLLVRIMGSAAEPTLVVVQTHSFLYNVRRWLDTSLVTADMRQLNDPAMVADDKKFLVDVVPTIDVNKALHASQCVKWLQPTAKFAGTASHPVRGREAMLAFARAVDTLCARGVDRDDPVAVANARRARAAAYEELTAVKWPASLPLGHFTLCGLRANLLA